MDSISSISPFSSAYLLSPATGPLATQGSSSPIKIAGPVDSDGDHEVIIPGDPVTSGGLLNVTA